ncbi:MAG: zinc ribbon domain-containing protein [Deltaproteobacteria bacterium]|nr:zinc ribbon domain-containing protein [Deltaproteobacteria bacterium]
MQCPRCQHENNAAAKFCEECGAKLVRTCSGCGHEVSPQAKFCPECGTSLTATQKGKRRKGETAKRKIVSLDSRLRTPNSELVSGERRQLTVMFCDLVGSTALSERLDPEELREVVRTYQKVSAEVIGRFEGHIA